VLAVDDDVLVLTNTIAMLEDLGHTGIWASSGKEALEILRRGDAIDLVITDQAMPRMTGQELGEVIKKEWPDLPLVITTGYAEMDPEGTQWPKLAKPFTEVELGREIACVAQKLRKSGRVVKLRSGAH
jgi:CheY-like chemotaxis protein